MKIGTLVKPRRNKGIPIDLISPDIKGYVTMELNQVGVVVDSLPSSYGTFVRLLVDGMPRVVNLYWDDDVEILT